MFIVIAVVVAHGLSGDHLSLQMLYSFVDSRTLMRKDYLSSTGEKVYSFDLESDALCSKAYKLLMNKGIGSFVIMCQGAIVHPQKKLSSFDVTEFIITQCRVPIHFNLLKEDEEFLTVRWGKTIGVGTFKRDWTAEEVAGKMGLTSEHFDLEPHDPFPFDCYRVVDVVAVSLRHAEMMKTFPVVSDRPGKWLSGFDNCRYRRFWNSFVFLYTATGRAAIPKFLADASEYVNTCPDPDMCIVALDLEYVDECLDALWEGRIEYRHLSFFDYIGCISLLREYRDTRELPQDVWDEAMQMKSGLQCFLTKLSYRDDSILHDGKVVGTWKENVCELERCVPPQIILSLTRARERVVIKR